MTARLMDQPLLTVLTLREALRRTRRAVTASPLHGLKLTGLLRERAPPPQLLAVPPRFGAGERAVAFDLYAGRFTFCGQTLQAAHLSIFAVRAPSPAFAAELNGFAWLRHHLAAGDALAARNARCLVEDFIVLRGHRIAGTAFEPAVAARRIIAWLGAADLLLTNADPVFAGRFLSSLSSQVKTLRAHAHGAPDGEGRLLVRIALAFASLCLPTAKGRRKIAGQYLADELDRQIFADGGHVSRDPSVLVSLLPDLIALRETYRTCGQALPRGLYSAIDRMLPALRFFRHGDGSLALFNGAGASCPKTMAELLAFDETLGAPVVHARQSGYHRLSSGGTLVVADTGCPPPTAVAGRASAGTLSFELSSGPDRIVVNCGRPSAENAEWRRLSRQTAAHSTVTLDDRSSSRFARSRSLDRFLGTPLVPGPGPVATSDPTGEGLGFEAVHDGYEKSFGLLHQRGVALSPDGATVDGYDRFEAAGARDRLAAAAHGTILAAARFHLHPGVAAMMVPGAGGGASAGAGLSPAGGTVRLTLRDQSWLFLASCPVAIEDSVFFADQSGARRTLQLVAGFDARDPDGIAWRFVRER